jgi:hypothetical protein
MTRRRHLCSLLAVLLAAGPASLAAAHETAADRAEAPAASPAPRKPRPVRRRAARRRDPGGGEAQQQAAPAPEPAGPRLEAAPVPNRDLEAPRAADSGTDRTRLSPSVIHKPLPSQGMATEGAQSIQEERLFFPAPGARLNVPFSY